ncbi:MAG: protoporphyrinogen oxidase [Chloroflexi bacterium]|nr:MAG: protoporphyrinogen oxidase [Chloroflexota bacterium]MBL1194492.1 protoporphyrinogen oxidase [Chloroflexota bacterium]NOH11780.1 protoporphyrinogen oxidase [Chloroflexota bacterium]
MQTTTKPPTQVVIIGGGITGLSVAWELQTAHPDLKITILEKEKRWGGKVVTHTAPGPNGGQFVIDGGPESFVTRKPEVWDLAHELGIEDKLFDPGSETRNMFVLDGGKPVRVPLSPIAFLTSSLMSLRGKARLLAEPFISPKEDDLDESLAEFAGRRLGYEASRKMVGPILAGIYNTDPEKQSILTTSPIMREMEAEAGSLFKAAFRRMRAARKNKTNGTEKPPRFVTLANGAQVLIDTLVEQLDADLYSGTEVQDIQTTDTGYEVVLAEGEPLQADAVILASPANASTKLLAKAAPDATRLLQEIPHKNIGTITLAYRQSDLPPDLKINGLMIPRREERLIDAVTFTTAKMPQRAPQGYVLLRVFFGGTAPHLVELNQDELCTQVQGELAELLNIEAEPVATWPFQWLDSFPQAEVGHLNKVAEIEEVLPSGLYVTGSSYRGIGVPDCIRQGRDTATKALHFLKSLQHEELLV